MAVWRKYFGPDALIFGIDIDQRCAVFDGHAGADRIGSQDDPKFLNSIVKEMGGLDVVIDVGSHKAKHRLAGFELLFPLLADGGIYICEDPHASYWPDY